MCKVPNTEFNLSWERLTSEAAAERLEALHDEDPDRYHKLTTRGARSSAPKQGEGVPEDEMVDEGEVDDSDVSLKAVLADQEARLQPAQKKTGVRPNPRVKTRKDGALKTATHASTLDAEAAPVEEAVTTEQDQVDGIAEGRGHRTKKASKLYKLSDFTRHWDEDESDDDDV